MPRKQRLKSKTGYYHIMCRGNERRNIFGDEQDKVRFIDTLCEKQRENTFGLHAFCLMDNHFHLMISEGNDDIAKSMKRITVSYVYYFNKKYGRVGHLFQDRFKSEIVEDDAYVMALARYIHQNPVKAGMVTTVEDYQWSSYRSYLDGGSFGKLIEAETVLGLFSKNKETAKQLFKQYMNEYTDMPFFDMVEKSKLRSEAALELFRQLLRERGIDYNTYQKAQLTDTLLKEFSHRTNWSVREIAALTGINKDKVNRMIRG
jgi:putative transposase